MTHFNISIIHRTLHFKQPAGTSRGIYTTRRSWFIKMTSPSDPAHQGIGECAPLPDLSCDASTDYESTLRSMCNLVETEGEIPHHILAPYPSMHFGLETALLNFQRGTTALFDTPFSRGERGIPINGLVWMGTFDEMTRRIEEKLDEGFTCIKLKIGAIDFDSELSMIKSIRSRFSIDDVEIRLDANGAFSPDEALYKLELLSQYGIHSIEQPIKQRQWGAMARLCLESPLPIALDEELIGVHIKDMKRQLLSIIKPAYLVLKPTLHGGIGGVKEWIKLADEYGVKTWITSALESNVGLNAIAQLAAKIYGPDLDMPQGLGTGQLFTDNIPMPIEIHKDRLWYVPKE